MKKTKKISRSDFKISIWRDKDELENWFISRIELLSLTMENEHHFEQFKDKNGAISHVVFTVYDSTEEVI